LPNTALADLRQKNIHHLLVIPDGSLHYVPFAMLRIKDKGNEKTEYLIEEFATSSVPAMTTLETIRKQKKDRQTKQKTERRQLLAFANPDFGTGALLPAADELVTRMRSFRHDYYSGIGLKLTSLPETEAEAIRVASLFAEPKLCRSRMEDWPEGGSVVCISAGASEEQAKRLLAGGDRAPHWRYLLFSTHGMADTRNGMLSCLALSAPGKDSTEDGLLQAQEVLDTELDTDLVMLSACQTGLGRLSGGEGLVGLSGAFFVAGAETVGASLWQVPSGPTGQLVTEFFKRLKEGKLDKAEALRQAQLQVIQQGQSPDGKTADYSDPFCWAAFVLMGEYK
jgi:CHAT domain-containing protein